MSKPTQLSFDYLLGSREWYAVRDAARILQLSERMVLKLWDDGQLSGHAHNAGDPQARKSGPEGRGPRETIRIRRAFLAAYLVKTARYDRAMLLQTACTVLNSFSGDPSSLIELRRHIDHLLTR